jgi:predicted ATPase
MIIGDLSVSSINEDIFNFYQRALAILLDDQHLEYVTTANCFLALGHWYNRRQIYYKSVKFYSQAYEIQKKIYPNNHQNLLQTKKLIDMADENLSASTV